jgi:phosphatidylinositol alpha 1,6-mannosyltransferase
MTRVAFFADCFQEVNGVALTSRKFARFAADTGRPFLTVRTGRETRLTRGSTCTDLELRPSALQLAIERDLCFDLLFARHLKRVRHAVFEFAPDIIHVTSPGHIGLLGAITAHQLGIPLVASWHTNVHEFGARRLRPALQWLPAASSQATEQWVERSILRAVLPFYRRAQLLFAPNPELIALLQCRTGLPCYLMERGIDTSAFSPLHRKPTAGGFVIGFVGRLSAEKNVRLLAGLDQRLRQQGLSGYRFLIVGDGAEREWLRTHIPGATLPGVLHGQALAEAYASMDVFAFPSETDTYGNVIQEALASGVPCIVSRHGGPKYLIREGEDGTGFVADSPAGFAGAVAALLHNSARLQNMKANARRAAEGRSWNAVFEGIYTRYQDIVPPQTKQFELVSSNLHQKVNAG